MPRSCLAPAPALDPGSGVLLEGSHHRLSRQPLPCLPPTSPGDPTQESPVLQSWLLPIPWPAAQACVIWGWGILHMACAPINHLESYVLKAWSWVSFNESLLFESSSNRRLLPFRLGSFVLKVDPLSYPNCFHIHFHSDDQGMITSRHLCKTSICIIMFE